jgi:hypothetical protein
MKEDLIRQHAILAERKAKYETLLASHAALSAQLSVEAIEAQLQVAEKEAKDIADAVSDQFNKGTLSVDEFMTQFKEAQMTYHMRKNKLVAYKATKEAGLG